MRILNLDGYTFVPVFRRLGHQVLSIGPGNGCDIVPTEPLSTKALWRVLETQNFRPDLVFWCDLCRPPWVMGLETLPAATIAFSIDQYCNPWHVPFCAGFDAVLLAQRDYLPLFNDPRLPHPVEWFPLFCDPAGDRDPKLVRDIPISFVGTLNPPLNPMRKPFLQAFQHLAPLMVHQGDYRRIFAQSRMVLNQSAVAELNYRLFQAMSCGAAVLTEEVGNGLTDLFTPGEDLYLYPRGDVTQAAQTARQALAGPQLAEVAASGQRKTRTRHSVSARARRVIELAEALLASGAPHWRQENAALVRQETARAYAMLATDEALPLPPESRDHYASAAARLTCA